MKKANLVLIIAALLLTAAPNAFAEIPICVSSTADTWLPDVSGDIIVWRDNRNGNINVYGYNLATHTEFPVCTQVSTTPSVSGNIVVWRDVRNGNNDIYAYNFSTQTEFPICTLTSSQEEPVVGGNIVVWYDSRNGNWDIYGYDISTSTEFPVCTAAGTQDQPHTDGNTIVWKDCRNGSAYADIYAYDIATSTEFPVCTNTAYQSYPAVDDGVVVWSDNRNYSDGDIYAYDISTSTEFPVCTLLGSYQYYPDIEGDIIVWQDDRNGNNDIYAYDLSAATEFQVCTLTSSQEYPAVSGNFVVWQDDRGSDHDIYGCGLLEGDDCDGAIEVFQDVTYSGSNVGATGLDETSCSYNDIFDVWHSFTPAAADDYTVSLCGSSFDTTLAVYDGCSGTEVICNDDYCGKQSQVLLKARAGYEYIIRVAGYDGARGSYTLNITQCDLPPDSDLTGDCRVNLNDFSKMASEWLEDGT
ncbi:MAG: hypothetical protein JW912_05955, partial [Sedimentisphaerales bacterium]|nr:hypothetical protein [Sedimentisphaerales bacterium]